MWALIATVGGFIPALFGKRPKFEVAKVLGVVILVVAGIVLLGLGKCAYDKSIINAHESERKVKAAEKQLEADRAADAETARQIEEFQSEQDRLEKAANDAARENPGGAAAPVGPVSQSYYDNLPKGKR